MSTSSQPAGTAGVGQPGFVARHGLLTGEQAAAAQQVIRQIRDLDLRTVRFVVADQHGAPRSRSLSPQAAIDVFANGLDFSGAIYSLDTGNQVFVPAFAPGGGFGIEEFTGFPDVILVPDPATFRVLPWADRTGWMLCDAYFSNGQPVPLDGRALLRRQLDALAEKGYDSDAIRARLHEAASVPAFRPIQSQGQNPLEQAHLSRAQPHRAQDRSPEDQPRYRHAI